MSSLPFDQRNLAFAIADYNIALLLVVTLRFIRVGEAWEKILRQGGKKRGKSKRTCSLVKVDPSPSTYLILILF
jgi:hypothetical protein